MIYLAPSYRPSLFFACGILLSDSLVLADRSHGPASALQLSRPSLIACTLSPLAHPKESLRSASPLRKATQDDRQDPTQAACEYLTYQGARTFFRAVARLLYVSRPVTVNQFNLTLQEWKCVLIFIHFVACIGLNNSPFLCGDELFLQIMSCVAGCFQGFSNLWKCFQIPS